jgi:hypothetical protein
METSDATSIVVKGKYTWLLITKIRELKCWHILFEDSKFKGYNTWLMNIDAL